MTSRRPDVFYRDAPEYRRAVRERQARDTRRRLALAYAIVLLAWLAAFLIIRG